MLPSGYEQRKQQSQAIRSRYDEERKSNNLISEFNLSKDVAQSIKEKPNVQEPEKSNDGVVSKYYFTQYSSFDDLPNIFDAELIDEMHIALDEHLTMDFLKEK